MPIDDSICNEWRDRVPSSAARPVRSRCVTHFLDARGPAQGSAKHQAAAEQELRPLIYLFKPQCRSALGNQKQTEDLDPVIVSGGHPGFRVTRTVNPGKHASRTLL